ncbi:MAG: 2-oxoacid:acceptor oxidoreductase family protein, partial [Chromatiales bacterium]
MDEYGVLTGRRYLPVRTFMTEDADYVIVGLGSVTDDAEAVAAHLRREGMKVGVVSIKMLQPFPEGDVVSALNGKKAVTILERSETTALTTLVTQAMFKAAENNGLIRHEWIPPISSIPKISTGIFGLGAHDLQPRHLVAAFKNMENVLNVPFFYLGSQFFDQNPAPATAGLQQRLLDAYPETEFMAFDLEPNPSLLPDGALRIRFHSVGGYGTIATGKLLTDILAGVTGMYSKSAPKYGSEKSGAPTNYYITLSPEPIKITNAELEDVEVVVSPDHKVFSHTNPLKGLIEGGTLIIQSGSSPLEAWKELPAHIRRTIREKGIRLFVVDAFGVAKKHAPSADLEIRMMGIAFIGAVCGKVERVASGAPVAEILKKVRGQVTKKFGAKGEVVVESNMAVVQEGLEATQGVDYQAPEFVNAEQLAAVDAGPGVEVSVSMLKSSGSASASGMFDAEYYAKTMTDRFKDGSIAEAPVIPGVGMFMPSASAAFRDKGLFRLTVPRYTAHLCTGCMECAMACPDGAIPNTVHEIHDLLLTAINEVEVTDQQKQLMTAQVFPLGKSIRDAYRKLPSKDDKSFKDITAEEVARMGIDNPTLRRSFEKLVESLAVFPVVKTRPFFDAMEKDKPGSGGLYSVNVDPWKCSGCGECVDVCGPGALTVQNQTRGVQVSLQNSFQFLSKMPNTAPRFTENALAPGGDAKRVILDHDNYYAMTGGHGACRGCGEVTSLRLLSATNRALHEQKRRRHIAELEDLLDNLKAKIESFEPDEQDPNRRQRMEQTMDILEKRLYRYESGPTGMGPAGAAIANATGCSSVYASTFPFNPYTVPWVNSLFQDSVPVAKGIFEGFCASEGDDFAALRKARLDLEDQYDPEVHDGFFRTFRWQQFSQEELDLMPAVISIGGDGATYDIGFGALSRLLVTNTPLKIVVLNTGAYSNTGGQTSTASFTAQDSDLTRFGVAHRGKYEDRKELGLIAAFHPKVLVVQTNSALQGHFMKNLMEFLNYNESPAVLDTYTACMPEHGIGDDAGNRHARLAVESRMSPVFVHDPRKGDTLAERFSLEGNPDIGKDWTTGTLEYVDDNGNNQLMEIPLTPADFGVNEGRFKKHFKKIKGEADLVPLHEYIELDAEDRHGKTPFIWTTVANKRLVQLEVSAAMVSLTEERRRNWRMLEYLSGLHIDRMEQTHSHEVEEWRTKYEEANAAREASIDSIARGMAELAASSGAPAAGAPPMGGFSMAVPPPSSAAESAEAAPAGDLPLVEITDDDMPLCTNCKTCYQDLGELFELTRVMVDGKPKEVSRVKPG